MGQRLCYIMSYVTCPINIKFLINQDTNENLLCHIIWKTLTTCESLNNKNFLVLEIKEAHIL